MNWLSPTLLFLVAWLAVFAQTQFVQLRDWLGTPVGLLPALVVYAALSHGLAVTTVFAIAGSLWLDALTSTRLGVSLPALFLVGYFVHARQHLILRDQLYAQFWLGLAAGLLVPLLSLWLLHVAGKEIVSGWGTAWQLAANGLANGIFCPVWFRVFDRLRATFEYQPVAAPPFRADREIKYGRR